MYVFREWRVYLWSQNQTRFFGTLYMTRNGIWTMFVGCFAFISTRIFGIAIQNVQDDYSKIVESSESMSSRQGFAIFEPFDFQVRIFNGSQFCFQMATLSFSNVKLFVETRYKFGRSNIFGSGWSYISTFWKILKKNYNIEYRYI